MRVLKAIPDAQSDYRPDPKVRTALELAWLLAVEEAQQIPFLRGKGVRGWRAGFDWFIANHSNIYTVFERKYDGFFMAISPAV